LNSQPETSLSSPRSRIRRGSGLVRRRHSEHFIALVLLLPAIALLGWLLLFPIGDAVHLSFTSWDGFSAPRWIGIQNFSELIHDPRFKSALLHNLAFIASIPVWIAVPYSIAWCLHREIAGWRFFRFAFFLPCVLSPVVIGAYYGIVLNPSGPLDSVLRSIGLGGLALEWLNEPSIALPVVISIIIWMTFGIGVLLFLSGLANLDTEQIDAARVDGASPLQVQKHVIFWQLLPVIEFWTILIVITSFIGVFPLIYVLTRGGPGTSTFTVDYLLYTEGFSNGNFGYAAAMGIALLVIIGVTSAVVLRLLRWRQV